MYAFKYRTFFARCKKQVARLIFLLFPRIDFGTCSCASPGRTCQCHMAGFATAVDGRKPATHASRRECAAMNGPNQLLGLGASVWRVT